MSLDIEYQWVSILDSSTCPDCEDLDGQVFAKDDIPDFPAHAWCRCDLIPDIGSYND